VQDDIHLSVVATSRNDNHGGYLTQRTQHFVDGFVAQCRRHQLRAELLLVEWNPPADRPPLAEDLRWPAAGGPCDIRIVTVPREMHAALAHSGKLPLYQMIAKNVGIRRARGRFVLATNIDILFSDEVMLAMRDRLRAGCLYRVDRHDVPTHVPVSPDFGVVLEFCRREEFRLHATGVSLLRREGRWDPPSPLAGMLRPVGQTIRRAIARGARKSVEHSSNAAGALVAQGAGAGERVGRSAAAAGQLFVGAWNFARGVTRMARRLAGWIWHALIRRELHTNACGDFTLLSREDWFALRGYPEWQVYSWNIDSILLYQAHRSGLREVYLGARAAIYHIEHSPGSGFTPESSDKLFERLEAAGIPCLDWERDMMPKVVAMDRARERGEVPITYNDAQWGYAAHALPEQRVA
jgi:hypothetical protein